MRASDIWLIWVAVWHDAVTFLSGRLSYYSIQWIWMCLYGSRSLFLSFSICFVCVTIWFNEASFLQMFHIAFVLRWRCALLQSPFFSILFFFISASCFIRDQIVCKHNQKRHLNALRDKLCARYAHRSSARSVHFPFVTGVSNNFHVLVVFCFCFGSTIIGQLDTVAPTRFFTFLF